MRKVIPILLAIFVAALCSCGGGSTPTVIDATGGNSNQNQDIDAVLGAKAENPGTQVNDPGAQTENPGTQVDDPVAVPELSYGGTGIDPIGSYDAQADPAYANNFGHGAAGPDPFVDPTPDDYQEWDLIAGQHFLVGKVMVTNDGEFIYVAFQAFDDLMFEELHLYLGTEPPASGAPGKFPFKAEFDDPVDYYEFDPIPIADFELGPKEGLFMALHAAMNNDETAWGGEWDDEEGEGSYDYNWDVKWGGYLDLCLAPMPELPDYPVGFQADRFGVRCYWEVTFDDPELPLPPGGYDGPNGWSYCGWCVDFDFSMEEFFPYLALLYSAYDTNMPIDPEFEILYNGNLDFISYMINQRHNPTPGGPFEGIDWYNPDNYIQFQRAVWFFSNDLSLANDPLAETFADYAIANGDNFVPCTGEWYGIVLYPQMSGDPETQPQMIVIEVDP